MVTKFQKTLTLSIALALFLSACEGSPARNWTSTKKKTLEMNGIRVTVNPLSDRWAAWYSGGTITLPPLPKIKVAHISAIEQVSGCKVTGAEFVQGSLQPAYLEASVEC